MCPEILIFPIFRISYDERTGRIASLNGFSVISDATTSRSSGHGLMYETSKIDSHRQIIEIKMMFGDARAKMSIKRDGFGRAQEELLEIQETSGFGSKTIKTIRSFDGSGRLAGIEQGDLKTILKYNSDGRLEKLNDQIVEYHRGGALKIFADILYKVDTIGWVQKRNNISFGYDGKGRLIRTKKDGENENIELIYDHEDRLISIKKGAAADLINLYYGYPKNPKKVSHFSKNAVISTIFYDENNLPFAISSSDGRRFGVICDEMGTLRLISTDSKIVKFIERGIFGKVLEDLDPGFWIPVGYLGGIEIDGLDLVILENGRALDLISGRYLSISPETVLRLEFEDLENSIDLLALETKYQPFALPGIPEDFESWFKIVGLSPDLLPNVHLGLPSSSSSSFSSPVTHRLLNSFPSKLDSLSHINTIRPSRLIDQQNALKSNEWSIEDIGFSNLLLINENEKSLIETVTLPILDKSEAEIVHKLLDGSKNVDFFTWSPIPVRHFWKKIDAIPVLSSASLPHFTLVVNKENAELRNGKTKIIVHFANDKKEVVKKLTDDLRNREQISVWKAERKRVDSNSDEPLWINWTDREKRELKSKGSVSGYSIDLKSHSPYFSTIHSWKFVNLSN
ncbi:unnamed protein product [Caenorhabditis angaria]|uniref:Tox-GHH domain-containing protein n=1 Tax=Caenorhabditis angaria TaxID=860376 RepID=A0A9P1IJ84_9PELO|nr:unnamed protein product [Caenorhabditis angaria]CAI5444237.1 unnamed protein product [Caenorhabditis angaria]